MESSLTVNQKSHMDLKLGNGHEDPKHVHKEAKIQGALLFVGDTNDGLYFEPKNQ